MKLRLLSKIATCIALSIIFTAPAHASLIQSTSPANSDSYWYGNGWSWQTLGSVDLAHGTNHLSALTSTAIAYDQGWGGVDPWSNGVWIGLSVNLIDQFYIHVAGAGRYTYASQFYDISSDSASFAGINTKLAAIDWLNPSTTANIRMFTTPLAYPGWEQHVRNASFSITTESAAVPEPASIALLAIGLIGFAASRRKNNSV